MYELTLTDDEIAVVTGCDQLAAQERWFKDSGIPCFQKRGKESGLTVARYWFENAPLIKSKSDITGSPASGSKPNLSRVGKRRV